MAPRAGFGVNEEQAEVGMVGIAQHLRAGAVGRDVPAIEFGDGAIAFGPPGKGRMSASLSVRRTS